LSKPNTDSGPDFVTMLESARLHDGGAALPSLRWALLGNTTQDPMRPFLTQLSRDIGYSADIWIGGYDTALQDASAAACAAADVVVVALRLQVLAPALVNRFASLTSTDVRTEARTALEYATSVAAAVRQSSRALILVHTFETPPHPALGVIDARARDGQVNTIRRLNLDLADCLAADPNTFVIDLDGVRARLTSQRFDDPRTWHIGRVPYTRHAMRAIAGEYLRVVRAAKGRNRKCVVVDADGTLWGGIVGDDGPEGVRVGPAFPGSPYHEFQEALLALRDRGVLLALCSKNDPRAVADVFAMRAADMPLKWTDFAAVRVNWSDKARNLREIAAELNIGLDTLVFVDDTAHETALVAELLPAVHTILLPEDPVDFRDALAACDLFDTLTLSDEDRRRSEMYAAEQQRKAEEASALSVEDYLRGLQMEATVARVDDGGVARAAQLTQKTNQFNLTTRRYTEHEIRQFSASPDHDVFTIRVRDRLGDSGLVGVAILRHESVATVIDAFLMSCRVLGRGVEDALLAACVQAGARRGVREVIGDFIPTAKNARVADFYSSRGFTADAGGRFRKSTAGAPLAFPAHFKSVVVDGEQVIA
jgi:FkbH-like protein